MKKKPASAPAQAPKTKGSTGMYLFPCALLILHTRLWLGSAFD